MKKIVIFGLLLFFVAGCTNNSNKAIERVNPPIEIKNIPNQTAIGINISNFLFDPAVVTIKKGANVTWTNTDESSHSIISDDDFFVSSNLKKNQNFTFSFNSTGTYPYHCGFDPKIKGRIIVVE